jgi:hypothetical protein
MTRILGSSRSAIMASRRVRRPGHDGRGRRPPGSSRHHLRDERRELPPPRRARTQARPRPPAGPRDNHGQRLIAAPRQSNPRSPLARQTRRDDLANAATTPDSHPDCRCLLIQIAALQVRNFLAHGHFDQTPYDGSYVVRLRDKKPSYYSAKVIDGLTEHATKASDALRSSHAVYLFSSNQQTGST